MKNRSFSVGVLTAILVISSYSALLAQSTVNPNATPEAKALLDLYYRISGKYTLTGQHNYPSTRDLNSRFAFNYIGQTPVIWSSDMGFAKDGDKDSYLARPEIVKEAIRQHNKGIPYYDLLACGSPDRQRTGNLPAPAQNGSRFPEQRAGTIVGPAIQRCINAGNETV